MIHIPTICPTHFARAQKTTNVLDEAFLLGPSWVAVQLGAATKVLDDPVAFAAKRLSDHVTLGRPALNSPAAHRRVDHRLFSDPAFPFGAARS